MPRCSETTRSSDWVSACGCVRKRRGMTCGCVRGLLNCSTGGGWQSKRGQSGRSVSGVKRDRSVAASQSYAKQNCHRHAVSPLSCPQAEQHNCQHSTAHKVSDPQSESGIANGMRNKTQRSVSPAEWASSNLPARSERQKHAPPRWVNGYQLSVRVLRTLSVVSKDGQ